MKRQKKGFTITELVIVIAVIAVLAAVLIPTFVSLVRKANESKDIQLVHNLNTALTVDGGEHKTMQSALDAAFESGYDVDKINASATGNEILWDSVNDKFCYLKDGNIEYIPETELSNKNPDNVAYWQICNEMPTEQKYSIYAGENWTDEVTGLTVGFDAGKNTITSVIYDRSTATDARTVVIRTNSTDTTLIINAPNDTVYHYDVVGNVNVIAVKGESYHEHGKVSGDIVINRGRVVLEANANVTTVIVDPTTEEDREAEVKLDVVSGAKVAAVAATTTASAEYIQNLTTIPEEAKIEGPITINSNFAGGLGTEASPYIIKTGDQFTKIKQIVSSNDKKACVKLANDIEGNFAFQFTGSFNIDIDLDGHCITGNSSNKLFQITGQGNEYCSLSIRNGKIIQKKNSIVGIWGAKVNFNVEDCDLLQEGDYLVIFTNGNTENINVTILNSEIELKSNYPLFTLYFPGTGKLTLKNSTIIGYTVIRGGNTEISDCTFVSPFTGFSTSYDTDEQKLAYIEKSSGNAASIGAAITIIQSEDGYSFESFSIKNSIVKFANNPTGVYKNANAIEAYNLISGGTMSVTVENITYDNAGYSGYGEYIMISVN